MLYLQFIGLLDQVQHFPNTVDCSCLLVASITLVYIVVAGMFFNWWDRLVCMLFDTLIYLYFFYAKHIGKFISKASSYNFC